MATYKDLKVWQLNQQTIRDALDLLRKLPDEYAFQHIGKQLFRSASSIGANLAEGHDSHDGKEFARYISIAIRSAIETDHWLATLENLLGTPKDLKELAQDNSEVILMLKSLRKSIEQKRKVVN